MKINWEKLNVAPAAVLDKWWLSLEIFMYKYNLKCANSVHPGAHLTGY